MASAERKHIQGSGGSPLAGSRGKAPGQGVRGRSPHEAKKPFRFWCQMDAPNLLHSPYFCKLPKPQVIVIIHVKRLKVSSTMTWKWRARVSEAPSHEPPPPFARRKTPDLYQHQEWPLAKVRWTCPPQSTPWRRPWFRKLQLHSFSF